MKDAPEIKINFLKLNGKVLSDLIKNRNKNLSIYSKDIQKELITLNGLLVATLFNDFT